MHAEIARELLAGRRSLRSGAQRRPLRGQAAAALRAARRRLRRWPARARRRRAPSPRWPALAAVAVGLAGRAPAGPGGRVLAGLALLSSARVLRLRPLRPARDAVRRRARVGLRAGPGRADRGAPDACRRRPRRCFGLAALAKDPLGALAPPAAIGVALALAGRARPVGRWLPWPGVSWPPVLAFGWWVVAELREPGIHLVHGRRQPRAERRPGAPLPRRGRPALGAGVPRRGALLGAAPWVIAAAVTVVGLVRRRAWREPGGVALGGARAVGRRRAGPHRALGLPAAALRAARVPGHRAARRARLARAGRALARRRRTRGPRPRWPLACGLAVARRRRGVRWPACSSATDVATRKSGARRAGHRLPPWAAIRLLVGAAALVLAGGALALARRRRGARPGPWPPAPPSWRCCCCCRASAGALAWCRAHRAVRSVDAESRRRRAAPERPGRPRGTARELRGARVVRRAAAGDGGRPPQRARLRRHPPEARDASGTTRAAAAGLARPRARVAGRPCARRSAAWSPQSPAPGWSPSPGAAGCT